MSEPDLEWNDAVLRKKYDKLLATSEKNESSVCQRKIWTKAKIEEVVKCIKNTKKSRILGEKLTSMEYYWSSKYELVTINGKEHVTFKKKLPEDPTILIIPREEYYDILKPIHISCGHGGRDKMLKQIKKQMYIPKKAIEILNTLCPVCAKKKKYCIENTRGKESCLNDSFNVRGLLDILDFQFCPDGEYKWLLKYQDQSTKFFNFRPLKSNESKEVAMELVKIFLTFGAPAVLQSLTGQEPIADILKEVKAIWPRCKTTNGSNRFGDCELLKTRENRNNDIVTMLCSWINENNLPNWSVGCYFYQYHVNTSTSAYKAVFGGPHKQDFKSTVAPSTMLSDEDSVTGNTQQHQNPETEIHELNTATTSTAEENKLPGGQVKLDELKTDIKMELNDETYNTATNSTHELLDNYFDTFEVPVEIENSSNVRNTNSASFNSASDDPSEYLASCVKTELIEESENLKITCSVCQNAAFIEHTVLCFTCNNNIHNNCGISVTDEGSDSNVLCYECLGKRFPEFEGKVAPKGKKRCAQETLEHKIVKKITSETTNTNMPGPSDDGK